MITEWGYLDVDIEPTSGGGYNVGWAQTGEWLTDSVTTEAAGTQEVTARLLADGQRTEDTERVGS